MAKDDEKRVEQNPSTDAEKKFSGQWLTMTLGNTDIVKSVAEKGELGAVHRRYEEELPLPLTAIDLYMNQNSDATFESLSLDIEFNISTLPSSAAAIDAEWWQHTIVESVGTRLIQALNRYDLLTLPHEPATAYIKIDDFHSLRISAVSYLSQCTVSVDLVSTDDLQRASGIEPASDRGEDLTMENPYAVIEAALQAVVQGTDSVMDWSHIAFSKKMVIDRRIHLVENPDPEPEQEGKPSQALVARPSTNPFLSPDSYEDTDIPPIERTTTEHNPFDFIGGATQAKDRLQEMALVIQYPELAKQYDVSLNHFLLYGPGGTGKTSLVKAFAAYIGADLLEADSTEVTTKWVGDSGKQMKILFNQARTMHKESGKPVLLFVDEFDSIAPKGNSGTSERADIKNVLKAQLVKLSEKHPYVIFAGASNKEIGFFDEELIRAGRLEPLYVPKPTEPERVRVWQSVVMQSLQRFGSLEASFTDLSFDEEHDAIQVAPQKDPYVPDLDYATLAKVTDGLTGADFVRILEIARRKKFIAAIATKGTKDDAFDPITQRDIEAVIKGYSIPN